MRLNPSIQPCNPPTYWNSTSWHSEYLYKYLQVNLWFANTIDFKIRTTNNINMLTARTLLIAIFLYSCYLTPTIAELKYAPITCMPPMSSPIKDTSDCLRALEVMRDTQNPLEPAVFRAGECVIMLTRMFPQPENRDRVSRIMAMPPPDFGPRPEKARFHRELFPAVVERSRDVLVQCFDPPSIQGGNRPGDPAKTNTGWTHIEIRDHPEAPFTHAYGLAVTSAPPSMPKGIKIFELLLNTRKLSTHVYEGPARSRSPSRPP